MNLNHNNNFAIVAILIKSINIEEWRKTINQFTNSTEFLKLEIIEFIDGANEAFVTFKATLSSGDMLEKSRFLKVDNRWLYESGEIKSTAY